MKLEPEFAARAELLPADVPFGFLPPSHFTIGRYRVSGVVADDDRGTSLDIGDAVHGHIGGHWSLRGRVDGPDFKGGGVDCEGPRVQPYDRERLNEADVSMSTLGCDVTDGTRNWKMRFDLPAIDPAGEWNATVHGDGGRVAMQIQWRRPAGALKTINVAGYYVWIDRRIVGAIEIVRELNPRVYVSRDLPVDIRRSVMVMMIATYLIRLSTA